MAKSKSTRAQSPETVVRLLNDLHECLRMSDFSSKEQDRALRQAIAVVLVLPTIESIVADVADTEECDCGERDDNPGSECTGRCLLSQAQKIQIALLEARNHV